MRGSCAWGVVVVVAGPGGLVVGAAVVGAAVVGAAVVGAVGADVVVVPVGGRWVVQARAVVASAAATTARTRARVIKVWSPLEVCWYPGPGRHFR
jgi:hypothetical protein